MPIAVWPEGKPWPCMARKCDAPATYKVTTKGYQVTARCTVHAFDDDVKTRDGYFPTHPLFKRTGGR